MKIACWNAEWAKPSGRRGRKFLACLTALDPECICIPESYAGFLPDGWSGIYSEADHGYPIIDGRRKVALWSRHAWHTIDTIGDQAMPRGRFVSGITDSSVGEVLVIGLCIPWRMAHVATGHRNRTAWEEHADYLRALERYMKGVSRDRPVIVTGDFNQRIPGKYVPTDLNRALMNCLTGFEVCTAGSATGLSTAPVCHIAHTADLSAETVTGVSRYGDGAKLSDHDGIVAELLPTLR